MSTATKTKAGFKVPCPHCGAMNEADAADGLTVNVGNLVMTCRSCDEEVTRHDLQAMVDDALRLIRWLDSAATA